MNCTSCRYELSLCLDGRLPSGRRGVVMQHIETCAPCNSFWNELQAAQRLALLLPRETVSEGFREQLWERIRAGEGTPEAVFREPVPMLVKVRYALTGAAAAAAVLLCATWLRKEPPAQGYNAPGHNAPGNDMVAKAQGSEASGGDRAVIGVSSQEAAPNDSFVRLEDSPLASSAQRLTTDVFALETARQLERRHALAHLALHRLGDPNTNNTAAIGQALDNATEFLTFGECLLEMRDRGQLFFTESGVDADLQFAVQLLGQNGLQDRTVDTVRSVVAPALRSSRLGHLASRISLAPLNAREDRDVIVRLNSQRPEVFPMLFFVFGTDDELHEMGLFRRGGAFVLDDPCGPSWVAPRSEVEARDFLLHSVRARSQRSR